MLARTLAGLARQTYPKELMQVVVADDGSSDDVASVLRRFDGLLQLDYVRQDDRGYRLAAVRNKGIRLARHDCIILLDADVIPVPEFIAAFMAYFHVTREAVLLGRRKFVDATGVSDSAILADPGVLAGIPRVRSRNPIFQPFSDNGVTRDWREDEYRSTNYLKESPWPFRSLVGAAAAIPRWAFEQVGGFCEDFMHWGGEDAEIGFRLYREGLFFIPVMQAVGLHQEPDNDAVVVDRRAGKKHTDLLLERKCPLYFRNRPLFDHDSVSRCSILAASGNRQAAEELERRLSANGVDAELIFVDIRTGEGWRIRSGSGCPPGRLTGIHSFEGMARLTQAPTCILLDHAHSLPWDTLDQLRSDSGTPALFESPERFPRHPGVYRRGDILRMLRRRDTEIPPSPACSARPSPGSCGVPSG
jgi:GT2 family glycosyltransferase